MWIPQAFLGDFCSFSATSEPWGRVFGQSKVFKKSKNMSKGRLDPLIVLIVVVGSRSRVRVPRTFALVASGAG